MGNKKYSANINKVGEGVDAELPEGAKLFGTIQKVTKELGEWQEQNDKRAFFLITVGESADDDFGLNLTVGSGGDDKNLAIMMHGVMKADKDLRKALYTACKLQDVTVINKDSNKQFN